MMRIKARIAITGRPGVGKTTLIERILERIPFGAGGMLTREIRKCGRRVGFSLIDLQTGREGVLAHIHHRNGPRMGRYTVNLSDLDGIGVAAISRALETCDVVVIDEIGPMEILSARFIAAVDDTLLSGKPTLISTHAHLDHPLIHRVRQESNHYRVKLGNRDTLIDEIVACFVL